MNTIDLIPEYPFVRRDHTCPKCLGVKHQDLLLCWPCHNAETSRTSGCYSHATELLLAARDRGLRGDMSLSERLTRLSALVQ